MTPTQYHNEGYKPECIRDIAINASCPVPVFFMLSVEKTMLLDKVMFAEKGIAGSRNNIQQGEDAFKQLNFEKIYHEGPYNVATDGDIKDYRQSEIIREGGFPVSKILRGVVCRSNAEREMFLYLLKQRSAVLYEKYKGMILYVPSKKMFYNNGIFVKRGFVQDHTFILELNSKESRFRYEKGTAPIGVNIEVMYLSQSGERLSGMYGKGEVNYCTVESIRMMLNEGQEYAKIVVTVKFDGTIMYKNEIDLQEDTLL